MTGLCEPSDLDFLDGVAWLTLNRPEVNSIDLETARDLTRQVERISDLGVSVVVVTGSRGAFSAGADVLEMAAAPDLKAYVGELAGTFHRFLTALADLDAVVIAAVDGVAAGAGLGLALAADIRIASDRAVFMTAFESLGFTPDSGTSFLLPRAVGASRAMAMSMSSTRVSASSAMDWGLVAEVVGPSELEGRVHALALQLAAKPGSHLASTRHLYRDWEVDSYRRHLDVELAAISAAASAPHVRVHVDALATRLLRASAARRRRDLRATA